METLTKEDRQAILAFLSENATDEILLRAAQEVKEYKMNIQSDLQEVVRFIGIGKFVQSKREIAKVDEKEVATRTPVKIWEPSNEMKEGSYQGKSVLENNSMLNNVTPLGSASKKIGSASKELILRKLGEKPLSENELCILLGKPVGVARPLLKLLHDRGLIKFDGSKFYLP